MSIIRYVDNLVSLSRTQSRIAQDYAEWAREPLGSPNSAHFAAEHDRLRFESVRHMRTAHSWRDRYYEEKEALAFREAAE